MTTVTAQSYKAQELEMTGRCKESRKIANNTYLKRRGEDIALLLHQTDVVTFKPNGDIVLNSGGWRTPTTKERINIGLVHTDYMVWQERGVWYLGNNGYNKTLVFADGMTIHEDGSVTGAGVDNPKADAKLKAKVRAYAKLCASKIPLDQPSGGDCWFCVLKTQTGQTMGDTAKDNSHFDHHIKEGYVVPALVHNALTQCYNAKMAFWQAFKDTGYPEDDLEFGRRAVEKAVYRYILKRYGYCV